MRALPAAIPFEALRFPLSHLDLLQGGASRALRSSRGDALNSVKLNSVKLAASAALWWGIPPATP